MAKTKDIPANTTTKAVLDQNDPSLDSFSGQLNFVGDHDWVKVFLSNTNTYKFYLSLQNSSSLEGDAKIAINFENGTPVLGASNDDGGVGVNALLSFTPLTTGFYYIDISDALESHTGDYSLVSALA